MLTSVKRITYILGMKQEQSKAERYVQISNRKKKESKAVITEIRNTANTGWNFLECLLKIEQKITNRGFDNEREKMR